MSPKIIALKGLGESRTGTSLRSPNADVFPAVACGTNQLFTAVSTKVIPQKCRSVRDNAD